MTIHDKIAVAVKRFIGITLSTQQVQALVLAQYPDTNPTSIIPSDHSGPNPRSGRSYCNCSGKSSQIFARDEAGYKVRDSTGTVLRRESCSVVSAPKQRARLDAHPPIVIDNAFLGEWGPKYERTENDEDDYQRLVAVVAKEMASMGTISKKTFLEIWKWKGAMRVIRHVKIEDYGSLYARAFRRAASEPLERKLAVLLESGVKLPGVEAATGSTIIHFIHPEMMPIIDVRTIGVLFKAGLISTDRKDLSHYEEFRRAIEQIRRKCPGWSLRQIDRALFAYHKQFLEKSQ